MLWYPKDDSVPKPPLPTIDPNSVILLPVKLNVGGIVYQTTERTLRSEPQSWFVEQLEKEWKRYLNGEIFIDRNGSMFEYVLDYLRHGDQTVRRVYILFGLVHFSVPTSTKLENFTEILFYCRPFPTTTSLCAACVWRQRSTSCLGSGHSLMGPSNSMRPTAKRWFGSE